MDFRRHSAQTTASRKHNHRADFMSRSKTKKLSNLHEVGKGARTVSPPKHGKSAENVTSLLPTQASQIPLILHQVFIQDGSRSPEMLFERYRPLINSCLRANANWTYYLWRNSDALALIKNEYPQYLNTFNSFDDLLQRSDAIRYLVLHHFGGIYLDMDIECFHSFHPRLTGHAAFIDQERLEQTRILYNQEFCAINSLMGSVPGHPFFRLMAERVLTKVLPGNVLESTGPFILTRVFRDYRDSPMASSWPVTLLPPSQLMDYKPEYWRERCCKSNMFGPSSTFDWRDRGCRMLLEKNWRLDETNNDSISVHRWLHLGYGHHYRDPVFSVTQQFGTRVQFYGTSSAPSQARSARLDKAVILLILVTLASCLLDRVQMQ